MNYGKIEIGCLDSEGMQGTLKHDPLWDDFLTYLKNGGNFLPIFLIEESGKFRITGREKYFVAAKLIGVQTLSVAIKGNVLSSFIQSLVAEGKLTLYNTKDLLKKELSTPMRPAFQLYCFETPLQYKQREEILAKFQSLLQGYEGEVSVSMVEEYRLGLQTTIPNSDGMWKHDYLRFLVDVDRISRLRSINGQDPKNVGLHGGKGTD